MANWEDLRIIDAVEKIEKEEIVLPVIQRELVWGEEKIELLFDTVLRGDSFGAIMTLKDWINSISNKNDYLKRHLIPQDKNLWASDNYKEFIGKRKVLIKDKLDDKLNV